ncbi:MAG: MBG domain-containing protein, partial [Chitinophagaceae bacterium]
TTRPITITPTSGQSKVYGNADPLFTYTSSEALQPGDAFSGELGRDGGETVAGSPYAFTLGSLTAGSNYTLSLGGANTFAITTKQVIITPLAGQSKVYGSDDPVFTFSNNGGLAGDVFTGGLGRISGNNVGTYDYTLGNLSAGTNYSLLLSSVAPVPTFAITIKSVTITPVPGQSKVYGTSTDPVFTFTNNAGLSAFDFTGALSRVSGNNAGSYAYTLGNLSAGSNYSLSLSTVVPIATFVITKAPLQVKADLKWINKGSPLPTFTSTITGLKNGDNPTVSYSLSPSCTGSAGVYTIIPLLKPFANSINYTITYTNNYLYINPKGSGADDVDTYLECVEDRGASYMPANRRYVARFYAKNTNSTPVYVPIGVNNSLSSAGSFDGSQQPVVFLPGNGTTRFNVPFDGVTLKWQLKTYEGNYLKTESVTASSSSVKCAINYAPAARGATDESNYEEPPTTAKTSLYPNPATNRVIIITAESVQSEKGIFLYDVYGRYYPAKVIRRISEHSFELDVSGLLNGVYLIRVRGENGYQTLRFVKG